MLTRIQVEGFKSLKKVDIRLKPVVVIFGPNAVGKSNILEAILLLSRCATERTLSDAFEGLRGYPTEAFSLPPGGLQDLYERDQATIKLAADFENSAAPSDRQRRRYRLAISINPKTGSLRLRDEFLSRMSRQWEAKNNPKIQLSDDGETILVRASGGPGTRKQEPIKDLNHTVLSNPRFSGERYVDFDELRRELSVWRSYYLDPGVSMRKDQTPREVSDIGVHGESLASFLYRLKNDEEHSARFKAVERALKLTIPTIDRLDVDLDKKVGNLDIKVWQNGTQFSSRILSEGTLRILALCAIAANPWPGSLVAFEEPENGVHPRRIEVIANLLDRMADAQNRQLVITTHSPTLVAEMARKQKENPEKFLLFRCYRAGSSDTNIASYASIGELYNDEEIRTALRGSEDEGIIEAALARGWLDGP